VKGPNKSAALLTKLNRRVREGIGLEGDENPTGHGFIFHVDIIALFYRFMQIVRFQHVSVYSRPLLIFTSPLVTDITKEISLMQWLQNSSKKLPGTQCFQRKGAHQLVVVL